MVHARAEIDQPVRSVEEPCFLAARGNTALLASHLRGSGLTIAPAEQATTDNQSRHTDHQMQ